MPERPVDHRESEAQRRAEALAWALECSGAVGEHAGEIARRTELEHPVNRSPRVVAAASVYVAALLENEKRTQEAVSAASGVTVDSISSAYQEIARAEGFVEDDADGHPGEPTAWGRLCEAVTVPRVARLASAGVVALAVSVMAARIGAEATRDVSFSEAETAGWVPPAWFLELGGLALLLAVCVGTAWLHAVYSGGETA